MFSTFRVLSEQIQTLVAGVRGLTQALRDTQALFSERAPSEDRLEELERSRAMWEAEMEALLLKADSTLKAANNAESRARTMVKSYEKFADPFDEDGEEVEEAVSRGYVPGSQEEEVLTVPLGLAPNSKEAAQRMKFS